MANSYYFICPFTCNPQPATCNSMEFVNLLQPKNIRSGIAEYFLLAPVRWFAEGGLKDVLPGTNIITDTHEFIFGKGFIKILAAPGRNAYACNSVGDPGFTSLQPVLNAFVPGSYPEMHETVKYLLNTPVVVLVKDANCSANILYQLGSSSDAAWVEANFDTGTTNNGSKGTPVKIVQFASGVTIYLGDIAVVNPEDLFIITEDGQFILTEDGSKILVENGPTG